MKNERLDAIWNAVPTADRLLIGGKRWVTLWRDGTGTLLPLAEYAEADDSNAKKKRAGKRESNLTLERAKHSDSNTIRKREENDILSKRRSTFDTSARADFRQRRPLVRPPSRS